MPLRAIYYEHQLSSLSLPPKRRHIINSAADLKPFFSRSVLGHGRKSLMKTSAMHGYTRLNQSPMPMIDQSNHLQNATHQIHPPVLELNTG
jgi:hypothetical protein